MNMRNVWFLILASILCLDEGLAGEWKAQPLDLAAPVFSATQNRMLATFNGQVLELSPSDSIWKPKPAIIKGALLAADSFHYFDNGTALHPDSLRVPEIGSIPDFFCCNYRLAEDAKRFYLRGHNGRVYSSEKSMAGWKPLSTQPPFSEGYQLMPFKNHYLMFGVFDILISHNRGATWEKVKGLAAMSHSLSFVKKIGTDLFAGFGPGNLYRSKDEGQNWSRLFPQGSLNDVYGFNGIAVSGDTIWLSAYDGGRLDELSDITWPQGVLRSVDAGKTWAWHRHGLPNFAWTSDGKTAEWYPSSGILHFAGELWTTGMDANANGKTYRSRDGGVTWQPVIFGIKGDSSLAPVSIGGEFRLHSYDEWGMDEYYRFDEAGGKWMLDSLLSYLEIRNPYSSGDTVYGQGRGYFRRKIGSQGKWENLFPAVLQDEFQYHPNGTEYIGISNYQVFRIEHSDDGGRTWSSQRPFLPQTVYRNRKVEARGKALYWPDDSLFTPPALWHAFGDSISRLWNWQDGILVQSGRRLFHSAQSGGTWQELALPDTGLKFVINENRLTGHSPTQTFTLAGMGSQWASRNTRFLLPRIVSLSKSKDHLFFIRFPSVDYNPQFPSLNLRGGYIMRNFARISSFTFPNHETSVYACSSYVMGSSYNRIANRELIDTLNYTQVSSYFYTFQTRWAVRQTPSMPSRALFADGDMMATAHDGGKILYSKNRGKTWSEAVSPPNITGFAGNAKMIFAVADSDLHHLIDNGAIWTSARVLATNIKQIAGTPSYLAVLTQDNQIQVTTDTGKTWTTLPALPPGLAAFPTAIAALDNEVFIGTQEHGIFGWSDGTALSIRQGAGPETGKRPDGSGLDSQALRKNPGGWYPVPGQPGQSVNAKGERRRRAGAQ